MRPYYYVNTDECEHYCSHCARPEHGDLPCWDELDYPAHCNRCGEYLAAPLTNEGVAYVAAALAEGAAQGPISPTLKAWAEDCRYVLTDEDWAAVGRAWAGF